MQNKGFERFLRYYSPLYVCFNLSFSFVTRLSHGQSGTGPER